MDLELSEEHRELREAAIGVLNRRAPLSLAREYLEGDGDAAELWSEIAELGWLGVGLDEDDPFGVPGLCLLAEQVGRRAAPTTLIDTAFVARIAAAGGSTELEAIITGDPALALALLEPGGSWSASLRGTAASDTGSGQFEISGVKTGVHHAAAVGLIAVPVVIDDAVAVALIEPTRDGVRIEALGGLDPSCAPCRVSLERVRLSDQDLIAGPDVEAALVHAYDVACVATTAEGLGAAAAALDLAVAYSLDREQYGHKIGSFQALKHLMAELHFQRETAWAAVLYAAAALQELTIDAGAATAVAKVQGADATKAVVEGALQVFGGVGFTREHDLHLLYRRALETSARFGDVVEHERRIAETLLAEPVTV